MSTNDTKKTKVHNTTEQTRAIVIRMLEDFRDKMKNSPLLTHDDLFEHPNMKNKPISLYYHISSQYNASRFKELNIVEIVYVNKKKFYQKTKIDLFNQTVLEKIADEMISKVREYDRISNENVQKKKAEAKNVNDTQKNLFTNENDVETIVENNMEIEDDYPTLLKLSLETSEQLRRELNAKNDEIESLNTLVKAKEEVIQIKTLKIEELELELEEYSKNASEFYSSVANSCSKFANVKYSNNATIKQ